MLGGIDFALTLAESNYKTFYDWFHSKLTKILIYAELNQDLRVRVLCGELEIENPKYKKYYRKNHPILFEEYSGFDFSVSFLKYIREKKYLKSCPIYNFDDLPF